MKYLLLLQLITLSSCLTMNQFERSKKFSKTPYIEKEDKLEKIKIVKSSYLDYIIGRWDYFLPYLVVSEGQNFYYAKTSIISTKAVYYNRIKFACGEKRKTIKSPLMGWNKDFDVSCSEYGCSTQETANISIKKSLVEWLANCKEEILIGISGKTLRGTIELSNFRGDDYNKDFKQGLKDLLKYKD